MVQGSPFELGREKFIRAKEEVGKVLVGQTHLVDSMLIGLLTGGHLLVEGLPGLAKTLAINTLSKVVSCDFKRIQFTPDLLPADLTGTSIYHPHDGSFSIKKGPIFTNILLADEINRAPAKVQSALLEVMQEKQVTIQGETFKVGSPFLVMATQNPIEQEGTYPLPEAETDRFMMKVVITYPSQEEEQEILNRMGSLVKTIEPSPVMTGEDILETRKVVDQIFVDPKVLTYILNLVIATRDPKKFDVPIEGLLQYGASPRATLALKFAGQAHAFLAGRNFLTPGDIKSVAFDILRHRLGRTYEAEAEEISPDMIIDRLFNTIPIP